MFLRFKRGNPSSFIRESHRCLDGRLHSFYFFGLDRIYPGQLLIKEASMLQSQSKNLQQKWTRNPIQSGMFSHRRNQPKRVSLKFSSLSCACPENKVCSRHLSSLNVYQKYPILCNLRLVPTKKTI